MTTEIQVQIPEIIPRVLWIMFRRAVVIRAINRERIDAMNALPHGQPYNGWNSGRARIMIWRDGYYTGFIEAYFQRCPYVLGGNYKESIHCWNEAVTKEVERINSFL